MATKRKAANPPKPKTLSPKTKPAKPNGIRIIPLPPKPPAPRITEDTALTVTAYWACIRFISEALATLPFHVYRSRPNGKGNDLDSSNDIDWLLDQQSNPETPAYNWREVMVASALGWGNGYAEIERYGSGKPAWLWQITPDRVQVIRSSAGGLEYHVSNGYYQEPTVLQPENVVHLRGLGFDGLVGYSVVQYMSRSLRAAMASQESASTFYENDATPGGVLEHPMRLSPTAAGNLRDTWKMRHAGSRNRREIAILEEGMKYHEVGVPPKDAQTMEMLGISVTDIARWFRVPPHKIGDLTKSSFNNIEAEEINAVTDCLMPWAKRFEQELNIKLFGRTNRGTVFCKHEFKGRLRGDTASQTNHITQMIDRGIYSVNEAKEYLDQNPIGSDGDRRFFPMNFTLLEKIGEDPPEPSPKQPNPAPAEIPNPDGENQPKMAPWQLVLAHACGRIDRREQNEIRRAKERKVGVEWIERFLGEHVNYMREELGPIVQAAEDALTRHPGSAQIAVEAFVQVNIKTMRSSLPHVLTNGNEWTRDPQIDAGKLLKAIYATGETNGN